MAQQLPLIESRAEDTAAPPARPLTAQKASSHRTTGRRSAVTPSPIRTRRPRAFAVASPASDRLVEVAPADWHIDQHTKEVGLAGLADARRALADAVRRTAA